MAYHPRTAFIQIFSLRNKLEAFCTMKLLLKLLINPEKQGGIRHGWSANKIPYGMPRVIACLSLIYLSSSFFLNYWMNGNLCECIPCVPRPLGRSLNNIILAKIMDGRGIRQHHTVLFLLSEKR